MVDPKAHNCHAADPIPAARMDYLFHCFQTLILLFNLSLPARRFDMGAYTGL
jgi:hypothetical protein